MRRITPIIALLFMNGFAMGQAVKPPASKRIDHVDTYHGMTVADPYRWLEDDVRKSDEVKQWVEAQNAVTFAYLDTIAERPQIKKQLTKLWNYEKFTVPSKEGGRYFYSRNDGLQNQNVLYTMDRLDGTPRVVIDPNKWTKDGTVALGPTSVSDDGKYIAYSVAEAGSDWNTIRVMDLGSMRELPDLVKWVKFSTIAWTKDGRGFYYSRYDEPKKDAQFQSLNYDQKVMFHRIGTAQDEDTLVYSRPDHREWGFLATTTDDGRYLVLTIRKGTDNRYRIAYIDLQNPQSKPIDLVTEFENDYSFVDNLGSTFFFRTDLQAPQGRLIAIDLAKPNKANFRKIVPQAKENLVGVNLIADMFVCNYLKDARSQVRVFDISGKPIRELDLPGIGTAAGFLGKRMDDETFYSFSSFTTPTSIYRLDLKSGKSTLFRQSKVEFDPAKYEVKQVFCKSKDGTQVPIFIASRKGLVLDGSHPTLLYGYGGFNISLTPSFSVSIAAWLEMGGVYAVANLRGGGEYGKEWHKAGTKLRKQNVFDDFIAAAEWLISNKYTKTEKLAIKGGSNGGLLVGACMTQRPDLFGACLPGVGVMDMLRFQKFTAGRFWTDDYGSSDNAEEFKALIAYSPYHNLKSGTKYPATMVTTADTDDRVVPGHSFKFTAAIQHAHAGSAPVIARIESKAGHGAGKPTSKLIEAQADEFAFLVKNLGMKLPSDYGS